MPNIISYRLKKVHGKYQNEKKKKIKRYKVYNLLSPKKRRTKAMITKIVIRTATFKALGLSGFVCPWVGVLVSIVKKCSLIFYIKIHTI